MSIIITQSLSWEIESNAFLKSTKHHIQSGCWCSRALCISILRFGLLSPFFVEIPPVHLQFLFRSSLGSFPVWSEEGSCLHVKQFYNCSIICTLFKITFLGKWDERGERPFLWPDRHTYSVHSVQYCLSFCFEQFCWDLIRNCGMWLAVRWMAQTTSERRGGGSCSQYFCSFPFPSSS